MAGKSSSIHSNQALRCEEGVPLKKMEIALHKLLELAIPLHTGILIKHRNNIEKYQRCNDLSQLYKEQVNARLTVQQLKADLRDIELLVGQCREDDRAELLSRVGPVRDSVIDTVASFVKLTGSHTGNTRMVGAQIQQQHGQELWQHKQQEQHTQQPVIPQPPDKRQQQIEKIEDWKLRSTDIHGFLPQTSFKTDEPFEHQLSDGHLENKHCQEAKLGDLEEKNKEEAKSGGLAENENGEEAESGGLGESDNVEESKSGGLAETENREEAESGGLRESENGEGAKSGGLGENENGEGSKSGGLGESENGQEAEAASSWLAENKHLQNVEAVGPVEAGVIDEGGDGGMVSAGAAVIGVECEERGEGVVTSGDPCLSQPDTSDPRLSQPDTSDPRLSQPDTSDTPPPGNHPDDQWESLTSEEVGREEEDGLPAPPPTSSRVQGVSKILGSVWSRVTSRVPKLEPPPVVTGDPIAHSAVTSSSCERSRPMSEVGQEVMIVSTGSDTVQGLKEYEMEDVPVVRGNRIMIPAAAADDEGNPDTGEMPYGSDQMTATEDKELMMILEQEKQALASQERLEDELRGLSELLGHFGNVVHEQGESIEHISDNITTATENVEQGMHNISRANQLKAAALPAVGGAAVGALIGGPVGLLLGFKLGAMAALGGGAVGVVGGRMVRKAQYAKQEQRDTGSADDGNNIALRNRGPTGKHSGEK